MKAIRVAAPAAVAASDGGVSKAPAAVACLLMSERRVRTDRTSLSRTRSTLYGPELMSLFC